MYKEIFICIITVVMIIAINTLMEKYTQETVKILSENLVELRNELPNEENENDEETMNKKLDLVCEEWDKRYNILTCYLEHNELEKIETNLTILKSSIECNEYSDAKCKLDEIIFGLHHIEEKNKLDIKNVF